jgi:AcrR family transcriptional regulator
MARRVGRPRAGDPELTRREILRAAEERFAAAGFDAATTREMASRAGVNVATLHYHFGDKRRLYEAVRQESARGELPRLPEGGSKTERLGGFVSALTDFTAERPSLSRLSLLDLLTRGTEADPRARALASAFEELGASDAARAAELGVYLVTLLDASLLAGGTNGNRERCRRLLVSAALEAAGLDAPTL